MFDILPKPDMLLFINSSCLFFCSLIYFKPGLGGSIAQIMQGVHLLKVFILCASITQKYWVAIFFMKPWVLDRSNKCLFPI